MKLDWFKTTVIGLLFIAIISTLSFGVVLSNRDTGSPLGASLTNAQRIAILEGKVADLQNRVVKLESGSTTTTTIPSTTTTTVIPTTTTTTLLPTTTTTQLPTTTTTIPPTTTTTIPPVFNLQTAINNASAGQTVTIPSGRIAVGTETRLKSGVSLQGAGIGKTTDEAGTAETKREPPL